MTRSPHKVFATFGKFIAYIARHTPLSLLLDDPSGWAIVSISLTRWYALLTVNFSFVVHLQILTLGWLKLAIGIDLTIFASSTLNISCKRFILHHRVFGSINHSTLAFELGIFGVDCILNVVRVGIHGSPQIFTSLLLPILQIVPSLIMLPTP